jgi:hypothetical protein
MGALVYGGKFEQHINHLYSPENIHETAKKFKEHEQKHGKYSFGDKFTKDLVPDQKNWADDKGSRQLGEAFGRHPRGDSQQDHRRHFHQYAFGPSAATGVEGWRERRQYP